MFGRTPKAGAIKLDAAMNRLLDEMNEFGPDSEEYSTYLTHLERIAALRKDKKWKGISPDQMILVLGNLFGILVIVAYEQKHVMTSKGLGFVLKSK